MKTKCWKCGSRFQFDESKIETKAIVKCPVCEAKTLIQKDTSKAEPHFLASAYKANQPQKPKQDADSLVNSGLLTESKLPVGDDFATDKNDNFNDGVDINLDDDSKKNQPNSTIQKISILKSDKQNQANKNAKANESNTGSYAVSSKEKQAAKAKMPDKVSMPSMPKMPNMPSIEKITRELPAAKPQIQNTGNLKLTKRIVAVSTWIVVIILLAGGTYLLNDKYEFFSKKNNDNNIVQIHQGQKYIDELKELYQRPTENLMSLIKSGELAYQLDRPEDYKIALGLFRKALILESDNVEVIVRYTESYTHVHKENIQINTIRKLVDLLDYAKTLTKSHASIYRAMAEVYLIVEQHQKASEFAHLASRLESTNPENTVILATCLLKNNPEKTIELLESLVLKADTPKITMLPLAKAYLKLGHFSKAEHIFGLRDLVDPTSCVLCELYGKMYSSLGLFENATAIFSRLNKSWKETPAGPVGLASVAWQSSNDFLAAKKILEDVGIARINSFSKNDKVDFYCELSHYSLLANDVKAALIASQKAMQLDEASDCARYHYILGRTMDFESYKLEAAQLATIIESLSFDLPKNAEVWTLKGHFFNLAGDFQTAIHALKKAVSLDHTYVHSHLLLAKLFVDTNNFVDAFKFIDALLQLPPYYWQQHPDNNYYTDLFNYETSLQKSVLAIDKTEMDLDKKNMALGFLFFQQKKFKEAKKYLDAVLANDQFNMPALRYLGYSEFMRGNLINSKKIINTALKAEPRDTITNYLLCQYLIGSGKTDEASSVLETLLATGESNPALLSLYSQILSKTDNREKAQALAKNAYLTDPNCTKSKLARYLSKL